MGKRRRYFAKEYIQMVGNIHQKMFPLSLGKYMQMEKTPTKSHPLDKNNIRD